MSYGLEYPLAAKAAPVDRATFIRRTYAHVAGSILALVGIEALLLNVVDQKAVLQVMWGSRLTWFGVLIAFMVAGWVAQSWANSNTSVGLQYMGLGLYVMAWAVLFLPLIIYANFLDPKVIPTAGILTMTVFGGLTLSVFVTKKDYSFLGPVLCVGMMIALGVIIASWIIGFGLGLLFCFAMVALISGYILYDTSNVMFHYRTDQHVAAALCLFADVALMMWYVAQILMMSSSNRD